MALNVLLRRLLLIALLILPQVYWLRLACRIGVKRTHVQPWLIRVPLFAAVVSIVVVLYDGIVTRCLPATVALSIAPPVQLWIFTSTFAFYFTKLLHALLWCGTRMVELLGRRTHPKTPDLSRRAALRQVSSVLGGAPFVFALYGYARERFQFSIERVDVSIPKLPPELDGMRVAQLSDFHAGDLMPIHEIRRVVLITNNLQPHLAVLTGDFLTRRGDPLVECIRELSQLRAPLGVWGCNGNHEIYADAENDVEELFAESKMRLLRQASAIVEWKGAKLNLIGIDFQRNLPTDGTVLPTLNGAERLVRRDIPNLLLSHNPDTFSSAAAAGVELTLSGHTHGGQINIEFAHTRINPARVLTKFIAGIYHLPLGDDSNQEASLYVNRGLGTLGLPARIGARPEITLLTLRRGSHQLS